MVEPLFQAQLISLSDIHPSYFAPDFLLEAVKLKDSNHLPPPHGVSNISHPSRRKSNAGILWPSRGASARWCHPSWLTLPWLKKNEAIQSTQFNTATFCHGKCIRQIVKMYHPTKSFKHERGTMKPGSIPQGVLGRGGLSRSTMS